MSKLIEENSEPANATDSSITKLSQLQHLEIFSKLNVKVKVVTIDETTLVGEADRKKQDVIIADDSHEAKLTLWEDQVDSVSLGRSYLLSQYVVRIYQGEKYISRGENSQFEPIEDIGLVAYTLQNQYLTLYHVTILGVPELDCYKVCMKCKARVEPCAGLDLGDCV